MNYSGWRLLLFAIAGMSAIVLLASLGVPKADELDVDRYSGRRIVVVRGVADAFAEARMTGDAAQALECVRRRRLQFRRNTALARLEAELAAEFGARGADLPEGHPGLKDAAEERAAAAAAEARLSADPSARLAAPDLLALLSALENDESVGFAVESFFAPLGRWKLDPDRLGVRPDEAAALASSLPGDPSPQLAVARLFQSQNRSRSRFRWLLRAYEVAPSSPSARDALLEAYVEHGRLREALLVNGTAVAAAPDDLESWRTRARLGGWLALPAVEREARERLLAGEDTPEARERLIDLCVSLGDPVAAIPHARKIAEGSTDRWVRERPARLALDAGDVDGAIAIYEDFARQGQDEVHWRGRILELALQDLRIDRAISELSRLMEIDPQGRWEKELEGLYRRRADKEALAALLEARLSRTPDDGELEREVLALHASLGHAERVQQLLEARLTRDADPRAFFDHLDSYRAFGMRDLEMRALAMARSEALRAEDVPFVAERLRPSFAEEGWRRVAAAVAERFPEDAEALRLRLELIEFLPDDRTRAAAARELGLAHAGNGEVVRAWIDRASWAGETDSEIEAREAWVKLQPDDAANRRVLGDLYSAVRRAEPAIPHWLWLAEREGPGSESALRLIDVLFAADRIPEAMDWLERRANLPETSMEDRLHVAEQLFGNEQLDRALKFYVAVLESRPDQPLALLRVGQIRSWTNDPRGAIPFLERRLEASREDEAAVRFYLGEAHWAILQEAEGRREHERALEQMLALPERTRDQETMVAKMLARLGRPAESRPIYERLLAESPDNVGLLLDYVEALIAMGDLAGARPVVERARTLDPAEPRALRADAQLCMREERYEAAVPLLRAWLGRFGPDAGVEADLGRSLHLLGEWRGANEAYQRSLQLQPGNRDLEQVVHELTDLLSDLFLARVEYRAAGEDSALLAEAAASHLLDDDLTRLSGSLGIGAYTGRAEAVAGGTEDVDALVAEAGIAITRRFDGFDHVGGGLDFYASDGGGFPVGGWLGAQFLSPDPFREISITVFANRLLEDPGAAPGLAGRTSGVLAAGQMEFGKRGFASAELQFDLPQIDRPSGGTARDGRFVGRLLAGWRFVEGRFAVGNRFDIREAPPPGLIGPDIAGAPDEERDLMVAVWGSYYAIRLLDDQELTTLLPMGASFDYLSANGRVDWHMAPGLGGKAEGYAGFELQEGTFVWGLDAGITWKRPRSLELGLQLGVGQALGRGEPSDLAARVLASLVWRW